MEILYDEIEVSKNYMNYGHDLAMATWSQEAGARFEESFTRAPMMSVGRMYETSYAKLDEESPQMTEDEWKESNYYRPGLSFPDGVNEGVASIVADRKDDERERQDVMSRAPKGVLRAGSMFAVDFAAQFMDPLNIASAYVPIVGATRFAGLTGKYGITGARAIAGATEGLVGAAIVEPLVYAASKQEQSDYGMYDSLLAVGFGAGFGSALHVGVGKLGDVLGISQYAQGKIMDSAIRDTAENVIPDANTYISAGYDPTQFRTYGPRDTLMKQIKESEQFSDEAIGAVFSFLDIVSKSAYNRGLLPDVDSYYGNILNKTTGQRRVVSGDIQNFVNRIMAGEKIETPGDRQFYANNKADIEEVLRREQMEMVGEADDVFKYFSDGLTDITKAFKTGDLTGVIRGLAKYLPETTVRTDKEMNIFIREFEKYLMEGKAPKEELQPMFDTFKRALAAVYENVADEHFVRTDFTTSKVTTAKKSLIKTQNDRNGILTRLKELILEEDSMEFRFQNSLDDAETTPKIFKAERKKFDKEMDRIKSQRRELSTELEDVNKTMTEQERIYNTAREESTYQIKIDDDTRAMFDRLLTDTEGQRVDRVVPEAELKRETERTGETPEIDAFVARMDATNVRVKGGKESAYSNYKNVTEEVKALKKMLDDRLASGEMTQRNHDLMSKAITDELDAVNRNLEYVDGILDCIL